MKIKLKKLKNGDFFIFEGHTCVKTPEGVLELNEKEYKILRDDLIVESIAGEYVVGNKTFYSEERKDNGVCFEDLPNGTWIEINGRKSIKINSHMAVDLKDGEMICCLEDNPVEAIIKEAVDEVKFTEVKEEDM